MKKEYKTPSVSASDDGRNITEVLAFLGAYALGKAVKQSFDNHIGVSRMPVLQKVIV